MIEYAGPSCPSIIEYARSLGNLHETAGRLGVGGTKGGAVSSLSCGCGGGGAVEDSGVWWSSGGTAAEAGRRGGGKEPPSRGLWRLEQTNSGGIGGWRRPACGAVGRLGESRRDASACGATGGVRRVVRLTGWERAGETRR
jgi:hypothetical protein